VFTIPKRLRIFFRFDRRLLGELPHFHPHLHGLVTDGVFTRDGSFIALPALDDEPFEKLWQKKVFDLLLKRGKIDQSLVTQMLGWPDGGALIKRVRHVDPLRCPTCGAAMKIVRFIEPTQPDLIQEILAHCGLADEPPRVPPQPPPQEIRELQYVSDLDFVQEPGPAEPVWSAG